MNLMKLDAADRIILMGGAWRWYAWLRDSGADPAQSEAYARWAKWKEDQGDVSLTIMAMEIGAAMSHEFWCGREYPRG